jgi:GT2 family glycosyltransferase
MPDISHQQMLSQNLPLVSILVLNYNGLRFLPDCFDSLLASHYPNYEICLVDNNSTDSSVEYTQKNYPVVKILQTHKNAGYSRAYNLAMAAAGGKYFVLLNNDVIVDPGWLIPLVQAAEKDPAIGALQPKILSMIDRKCFEYAGASGGYIDKYGYPFLRGRIFYTIEPDEQQYNTTADVFWTSGAAMFVRAEALKSCGNLDEDFVHHMEEIDWCWRMHLCGYKLQAIPEAVIYHYAGATIKEGSYKKLYWNHRNNIFMLVKNLETLNLVKTIFGRIFLDGINMLYSLLFLFDFKHAWAIAAAYAWLLTHACLLSRKRRQVQSLRSRRDEEIQHLIYPRSIIMDYFIRGNKTFAGLGFRV